MNYSTADLNAQVLHAVSVGVTASANEAFTDAGNPQTQYGVNTA
jgi:hypothetical protein